MCRLDFLLLGGGVISSESSETFSSSLCNLRFRLCRVANGRLSLASVTVIDKKGDGGGDMSLKLEESSSTGTNVFFLNFFAKADSTVSSSLTSLQMSLSILNFVRFFLGFSSISLSSLLSKKGIFSPRRVDRLPIFKERIKSCIFQQIHTI